MDLIDAEPLVPDGLAHPPGHVRHQLAEAEIAARLNQHRQNGRAHRRRALGNAASASEDRDGQHYVVGAGERPQSERAGRDDGMSKGSAARARGLRDLSRKAGGEALGEHGPARSSRNGRHVAVSKARIAVGRRAPIRSVLLERRGCAVLRLFVEQGSQRAERCCCRLRSGNEMTVELGGTLQEEGYKAIAIERDMMKAEQPEMMLARQG